MANDVPENHGKHMTLTAAELHAATAALAAAARVPAAWLPPARSRPGRAFLAALALAVLPATRAAAVTVGGELDVTSDYIYRGLSYSYGQPAEQLDLHVSTMTGTFAGLFGSTRNQNLEPGAAADLQLYLGQRFMLSDTWNATLEAYGHHYAGGKQDAHNDYEEFALSFSYLDLWNVRIAALPNDVRYTNNGETRAGRYAAYVAETATQWQLWRPALFLTAGAGFYYVGSGANPAYSEMYRTDVPQKLPSSGYAYGNVGLAYQHRRWRLDVGYFLAQQRAQQLLPYPTANRHVAATLSWSF